MVKKTKKERSWDEIGKEIGSKIDKECCKEEKKSWVGKCCGQGSGGCGAVYGIGFLGALVYFVTTAPDFWGILIGIVKSIFWPGVVVYGVLKFLGM